MKNLETLLTLYPQKRLWILSEDAKTAKLLGKQLESLHATFINGKPVRKRNIGHIMAVSSASLEGKKDVAYVSGVILNIALRTGFQNSFQNTIFIDFKKYINGEKDFLTT